MQCTIQGIRLQGTPSWNPLAVPGRVTAKAHVGSMKHCQQSVLLHTWHGSDVVPLQRLGNAELCSVARRLSAGLVYQYPGHEGILGLALLLALALVWKARGCNRQCLSASNAACWLLDNQSIQLLDCTQVCFCLATYKQQDLLKTWWW